ncbi:50S ribosomal protein L25/general stress protein Ctc [Emcibacter nanhaiensis]|uniref:Large ribosomal subunit protein bL25 n=1 Tax=Emcibacter nanhaiensis TaxID=1505037 RepID=A0A501PHE2_9PROT|nr:50S ribosomal protein L25/general stress protein Ctc [Emcibacter nanhaiensis]TPD59431.1 50S ribosomal protein L25/general stress protein Ctc [Emcibacter nanhaiensis]
MANPVLKAELREKAGKGSSRALRREGKIPAVVYGNKKDPVTVTIDRIELVKQLNTGGFLNTTYDIEVGGKKEMVLPRDVQFHPVTDWPLHVDFLRLAQDATVNINIPVHFVNEETCPGLKAGGVLNVVRHEVEFSCPANAIPEAIEIDISALELGESVHISSVKLPEGVTPVIEDRDFTIATIAAPSGLKSAEAEEAEEGEGEAAEAAEEEAGEE